LADAATKRDENEAMLSFQKALAITRNQHLKLA